MLSNQAEKLNVIREETREISNKEEVLKLLFVGFSNKQKLENLRFFII